MSLVSIVLRGTKLFPTSNLGRRFLPASSSIFIYYFCYHILNKVRIYKKREKSWLKIRLSNRDLSSYFKIILFEILFRTSTIVCTPLSPWNKTGEFYYPRYNLLFLFFFTFFYIFSSLIHLFQFFTVFLDLKNSFFNQFFQFLDTSNLVFRYLKPCVYIP